MIRIVRVPMFNGGGEEWFIALDKFAKMPLSSPRVSTREQLIEILEYWLEVAKNGEVLEVEE